MMWMETDAEYTSRLCFADVVVLMGSFGGKWKLEVDAGYLRSKRREVATQQVLMGLSGEDIVAREMKYHKRLLRKTFYGKDK